MEDNEKLYSQKAEGLGKMMVRVIRSHGDALYAVAVCGATI